jgi:hypothetical protein
MRANSCEATPTPTQAPLILGVGLVPATANALITVPAEEGQFAAHGLNINVEPFLTRIKPSSRPQRVNRQHLRGHDRGYAERLQPRQRPEDSRGGCRPARGIEKRRRVPADLVREVPFSNLYGGYVSQGRFSAGERVAFPRSALSPTTLSKADRVLLSPGLQKGQLAERSSVDNKPRLRPNIPSLSTT